MAAVSGDVIRVDGGASHRSPCKQKVRMFPIAIDLYRRRKTQKPQNFWPLSNGCNSLQLLWGRGLGGLWRAISHRNPISVQMGLVVVRGRGG